MRVFLICVATMLPSALSAQSLKTIEREMAAEVPNWTCSQWERNTSGSTSEITFGLALGYVLGVTRDLVSDGVSPTYEIITRCEQDSDLTIGTILNSLLAEHE